MVICENFKLPKNMMVESVSAVPVILNSHLAFMTESI